MITQHDQEIQASRTRRNQETSRTSTDSDRSRGDRQASAEASGQPVSADRDDRQGRNFTEQHRQATIGGIIDRLISKTQDLIEESEARTVELKKHLEELKNLSEPFIKPEDTE